MEKLIVLLTGILLIVLGARGTYKQIWALFFPNEPIVTTPATFNPTAVAGILGAGLLTAGGQPVTGTSQQQKQGTATNPNEVGQQLGNATKQWIGTVTGTPSQATAIPTKAATGPTKVLPNGQTYTPGGSVYPVQSVPVQPTYQKYVSNAPSWWPSWLPWNLGG